METWARSLWNILALTLAVNGIQKGPPPSRPPESILAELTQQHQIPVEYYYVDDSNKGQGTHYKYSSADIDDLIKDAKAFIRSALQVSPSPPPGPSSSGSSLMWSSQVTDLWLIHALHKYPVSGANAMVFGSTSPWYESLLLALGVQHVTVLEYNRLTYDHPNITTVTVHDYFQEEQSTQRFDVAFSLSSFDHDGLGRYGDPIDPNADLKAMETAQDILKPNGILFLTIPIGPDVIVWNLHRRYGRLRLPLLLERWQERERMGWNENFLDANISYVHVYEPIFVLQATTQV